MILKMDQSLRKIANLYDLMIVLKFKSKQIKKFVLKSSQILKYSAE